MDDEAVRERAADLPREPGVYTFRDGDTALYVGKAVDLRSRVRSYADPRSPRIRKMRARAGEIEIAVTDTETQALLLEANLIKRNAPRYNVRLTDDKSYPVLQLTDHEYPRIEITRDPEEGATVFGPYTDKGRVETVVKALRETFGVRGCSDHKFANRDRPCLDYEMGLCTAPCTGEIEDEAYLADVESVTSFLEGSVGVLAEPLRTAMDEAAEAADFERAAHVRDHLEAVEAFHGGGSDAVKTQSTEVEDVLAAVVEGDTATVARLRAEGGQLVGRERHWMDAPESGSAEEGEVLAAFVPQFYAERDLPDAILLSHHPEDDELEEWLADEGVALSVPGAGREATLVDLALKNARHSETTNESRALASALGIESAARIEGFDVSHAQGKDAVGSDVCFVEGSPEKPDYRRRRLAAGNDDYENMRALVTWRAERALEGRDDRPDPDLLLIDGGEGQLNAALDALETTGWDVPAVALAKEEERVVTPDGPAGWESDEPQVNLLRRVRDEAHRFAVQYHRKLRDDVSTALDGIEGVGPARRRDLLRRFGSVEGVRAASPSELTDVDGVGPATAERIAKQL